MRDSRPEKIVIVTGPTFGATLGLLLIGATIGAVGATCVKSGGCRSPQNAEDGLYEGLSGDGKEAGRKAKRSKALLDRMRKVAGRAQQMALLATEAVTPAIQNAILEARAVAEQTERELEKDLHSEKD